MKRLLCVLLLAFSLPAFPAENGDERVLAARDAVQRGDRAKLAKQLEAVRGHDLEPYVEYWLLRLRLEEAGSAELREFLARQSGSYLAEKLRVGQGLRLSDVMDGCGARQQELIQFATCPDVLARYERILVPEMNLGQLALLLRAQFLVDAVSYTKVRGRPLTAGELADAIGAMA